MANVETETTKRKVTNTDLRPGIQRISIVTPPIGPFTDNADAVGAKHLSDIEAELEKRAQHYLDLKNFVRSVFDNPQKPVGEIMQEYWPDSKVKRRNVRAKRQAWQNEHITIIEDWE
jgi:hypothetical protein